MKAKIINRNFDKTEIAITWHEKLIHLVFIAVNGPSLFMNQVCDLGGMPYQKAVMHANTVNNANETGTLHPQFAVTVVPQSIYGNRNDFGNRSIMKKNIDDCFLANEKYVHAPEIFFMFEDRPDFDKPLAIEMIIEANGHADFTHTQIISCLPVNGL